MRKAYNINSWMEMTQQERIDNDNEENIKSVNRRQLNLQEIRKEYKALKSSN